MELLCFVFPKSREERGTRLLRCLLLRTSRLLKMSEAEPSARILEGQMGSHALDLERLTSLGAADFE